ncbi:patatin-like phospholipase family protein [Cellulomonas fimi]|uniref:Patatin n=1 Tax=Cellulomonas fimi (strain ATCC 484 / DSM 20113 / JCM 1341 / CCUG 24087 / LMG 16345 / NBRC 15513 / NCIMB 8980 / NCTC 7547 / NRS-133) TaxID=590998 RepID=F4H476_CELFA|nr:patatin-like phospholipase family protein [Cellulomonas fimi]AEE45428.1 Patatin [Cellulomonas fimi ATCC 484]VEH29360.1 Patatin-like phospholipase [Cellulomonas fimi]
MRSLVLAGGGMRVAWQAGVVRALEEDGLVFDHVDGTSGGILTAAMLCSGVDGASMCRRWRDVDVRDFGSALPLRDYLTGPWNLPAVGDADGLVERVFPALGIDVDAIRRSPLAGSFTVVDFATKRDVAVDARDVDAPLLAAGMSLPLFLTPLHRDGHVWTDAVWVRDANLTEALRRGADEVWLVWCIGDTDRWGDGPLEQYVHMIEMSAAGALAADLALARAQGREFVLHVVVPAHPLPLDPEFYLGRVSADSLVQMGYRDARRYLATRSPVGVPHDPACTRMTEPPPSARYVEHLTGRAGVHDVVLDLTVVLPLDGPVEAAQVAGALAYGPWGERALLAHGRAEADDDALTYRGLVRVGGRDLHVQAVRSLVDDPGPDAWGDLSHVALTVREETGDVVLAADLELGADGLRRLVTSVEPVGVSGVLRRVDAVRRLLLRGAGARRDRSATVEP